MLMNSTARRFKAEGDRVYERVTSSRVSPIRRGARFSPVFRTAVAAFLVIALVIAGRVLQNLKGIDAPGVAFDFNVVAFTDEPDGSATSQEISGANVLLPSGRIVQGYGYQIGYTDIEAYDVFWQVGKLMVSGDNIESVTFTAKNGGFANYSSFHIHPVGYPAGSAHNPSEHNVYNYTRHYIIDEVTYAEIQPLVSSGTADLHAYLQTGALDYLIGRDFRDELCKADPSMAQFGIYAVRCGLADPSGYMYGNMGYQEDDPQHYELQFYCMGAEADAGDLGYGFVSQIYWQAGQSITVSADQTVSYCPAFEVLEQIAQTQGPVDYLSLATDTVEITVTSTSGETLSKTVYLNFNQYGELCASFIPRLSGGE